VRGLTVFVHARASACQTVDDPRRRERTVGNSADWEGHRGARIRSAMDAAESALRSDSKSSSPMPGDGQHVRHLIRTRQIGTNVANPQLKGRLAGSAGSGRRMLRTQPERLHVNIALDPGVGLLARSRLCGYRRAGVCKWPQALSLEGARFGIRVNALARDIRDRAQR